MDLLIDIVMPIAACCGIGLVAAEFVACWIEDYGEDGQ